MLIKANTDGILVVPYIDTTKPSNPGDVTQIALVPGWNEIPMDKWPLAEPHLRALVADGRVELRGKEVEETVEEIEDGKPVKKTVKVLKQVPLGDVRADHARKIVEGCFNFRDLESWKEDSTLTSELRNLSDIQLRKIQERDTVR